MRQIQVGKKFLVKVPNGLALNVEVNLSGTRRPTVEIVNSATIKQPSISYSGQRATIHFAQGTPLGASLELLVLENGVYLDPEFVEQVEQSKAFREEIEELLDQLYPVLNVSSAMTFDQCYWTRGVGQIEIIKALEIKQGDLWRQYQVFGGMGFGAIQALALAFGCSADDLDNFWMGPLKSSLSQAKASITGQREPAPVKRALAKFFRGQKTKIDPTLKDLRAEVFIPLMDINGKPLVITKAKYPMMRIADAAALACLDPIEFKMKAQVGGYSIIGTPLAKSVDYMLTHNNKGLKPVSVGCPSRIIDYGNKPRSVENLAIINQDRIMRLSMQEPVARVRYECGPIDMFRKFDFGKKAISAAINSAYGVV
jgi:hypothetical protein